MTHNTARVLYHWLRSEELAKPKVKDHNQTRRGPTHASRADGCMEITLSSARWFLFSYSIYYRRTEAIQHVSIQKN